MKLHIALVLALGLACSPALAQKPEWAGEKGKGHKKQKHFNDDRHGQVRVYYEEEFRRGHCPPGLAKKNNGCTPPGLFKKWSVGRPLPPDVVIYDVPPDLQIRIGLPPAGHKYVRVAADILLIAIGTKVVVDAVRDLGRV